MVTANTAELFGGDELQERERPIREADEIRQCCSKKLHGVQLSPHFRAILACLLGQDWTTPRLVAILMSPDGHLLGLRG